MNLLEMNGVGKIEQENFILQNISFTQQPFEKIAIAGAAGSGKTSLLKIIAGLTAPTEGEVLFDGTRVKSPEEKLIAGHSQIAYLSQQFELLNHYRVEEILEMKNLLSNAEAQMIYKICSIDHLLKRWTHQLSGGEKQRIALASLLVAAPKLLLLDEPYSNLDSIHKNILKKVINEVSTQLRITCILVSHDPVDVLSWAETIFVLKQGKIIQKGKPVEIYKQPVDEYTAALFGKYNLVDRFLFQKFSAVKNPNCFIRPESIFISCDGNGIQGKITSINFMGSYYEIEVQVKEKTILSYSPTVPSKKGAIVFVSIR